MIDSGLPVKRHLRRAVVVVLACYWLAAFGATHLPVPHLEDLPSNSDKGAHFILYGGLAYLLCLLFYVLRPWRAWNYALIFAIAFMYAVVDEWLQTFVNRNADFADGVADAIGALAGMVVFHLTRPVLDRYFARGPRGASDESTPAGVKRAERVEQGVGISEQRIASRE